MTGWEIYSAQGMFPRYIEDWDRLNFLLYQNHPFFDSRFVGALLDHFATGSEKLCIYKKDGLVAGALILQPLGWGRWMSFRPGQAQITAVLLEDSSLLLDLLKRLPGLVWTIELIAIDPRYSPNFLRPELISLISLHAYTIGVHSGLSFVDYWNTRPNNLKANIRRYTNRLEKEFGSQALVKVTDPHEMESGVGRYGALESSGWKGAAGSAISADNVQGAFYSEVMRRFALVERASIYEQRVADSLVASRLMIENAKMGVILKTTYDENFTHIAPGRIQLYHVIEERLTNKPEQVIEFYTNATRDQAEWASFGCPIQNVQVFRGQFSFSYFAVLKSVQYYLRRSNSTDYNLGNISNGITVGSASNLEMLTKEGRDKLAEPDSVELSPEWFELLRNNVYRGDGGVKYFYAAENNEIAVLLPLRFVQNGPVKTVEALSNFYTSQYSPMRVPDSKRFILRHLLREASREFSGAHVMRFSPMDPESPAYSELLNELRAIGWIPFQFFCFVNWFLEVNDSWEGYLKTRRANLRSTIKRKSRDFSAAGGTLEVVTASDQAEQIERAIAAYQEVYSASWKVPEPYQDFVPSLIRHLAETGTLRLGVAHLKGKPIAAQIWICTKTKACIFKVAYDQAYAGHSPGTILTAHLLHYVMEIDCVNEVDYLIGDDEYKRHWMSGRRERWGIVAYNPLTIIGFFLLLKELLRRIAKKLWTIGRKLGQKKDGGIR
jgi:hypothetical protein